jgi:hypothetical protein
MTTPYSYPVSVGQLLAMDDEQRIETIRAMPPTARRMLAHLASIGAASAATKALEHLNSDGVLPRTQWSLERIKYAHDHALLAATLTTDPEVLG